MEGSSIIRVPCGGGGSSLAGASQAPSPATSASLRPIHSRPFVATLPSLSRTRIHASSNTLSSASRSAPCVCDEDPSLVKEENVDSATISKGINIFEVPPSREEADAAVSTLQMISSQLVGDESNPAFDRSQVGQQAFESSTVLYQSQNKVLNALHLLRNNPSVKSMAVSLSTDKAVWNAIMKNEMVQELKKSYHADKYLKCAECACREVLQSDAYSANNDDFASHVLSWLFGFTKALVLLFVDNIIALVNKLFDPKGDAITMGIATDLLHHPEWVRIHYIYNMYIIKRKLSSFKVGAYVLPAKGSNHV